MVCTCERLVGGQPWRAVLQCLPSVTEGNLVLHRRENVLRREGVGRNAATL